MNTNDINLINYKSNSSVLVDYLEGVIADEMILNSYIRDLVVVNETPTSVSIRVNSQAAKDYIIANLKSEFEQAAESVYENKLTVNVIFGAEEALINKKVDVKSKNIAKKFIFDTYVTSDFNKEVVEMSKRIVKDPGKYSPLYIASKSGLGKTHLLHAIGNKAEEEGYTSIYVEPNKFTKDVYSASQKGGGAVTELADSYKKYDFLLFDDIQNLGDREVTLKVLFEIINHQIENDKQIVIVSDRVAQELSGFESRFITRFVSGISSKILEPTTKDMETILKFKLLNQDLDPETWEKEALTFVARNNTSSVRALEGAIKRIVFYTESDTNVKYTFNVVSNIFKDLSVDPAELTPTRIIAAVANYYKINKSDIIGKSRKKEYVLARHIAIYTVRELTHMGYTEIGKEFGGRDHSTIISAVRSIDQKMKINSAVKLGVSAIENKVKKLS